MLFVVFFFFKQKTAYEMRISDWSSDVCSSDLAMIPVVNKKDKKLYLRDVAKWSRINSPGEYDRLNQQRFITITANIHDIDLGNATGGINEAIADLGELTEGIKIRQRGQIELLDQQRGESELGLLISFTDIYIILGGNFHAFKLS